MTKEAQSQHEIYPLSVVIATLGGDPLAGTIEILNSGIAIPAEILICIPEQESHRVENLHVGNVAVVRTPCRGQVAQRAYGLRRVRHPLVLQMDDDIVLPPEDLSRLLRSIHRLGPGNAVAPLYRELASGRYITEFGAGINNWIRSLFASVVCGAPWGGKRMGVISPAGIGYWFDRRLCGDDLVATEWIPGGCALCHREDLVTEDYYPFSGKAYSEDLIHSILWRKRGVNLWANPMASCMTAVAPMPSSWSSMQANLRAHRHVVNLIGGAAWRLRFWYVLHLLKQAVFRTVYSVMPGRTAR